jgi:hypothetical protein
MTALLPQMAILGPSGWPALSNGWTQENRNELLNLLNEQSTGTLP